MLYTDQMIVCADCGTEFTFSAQEQEFYAQKGFTSVPKRCKPCRNAHKEARSGGSGGGYSSSGGGYSSSSGGGYSGGGSSGGGYGAPREREMHTVTCGSCGVETQVPFKPRGDRPVYCRDCFKRNG